MKDFSASTFKYNGNKYTFAVRLYFETDEINLDNNTLECFEYESELNGLVQRGSITYIDELGQLDKCVEQYNVMCQVTFVRNEQLMDGGFTLEKLSEVDKFTGMFIVDNIEILQRDSTRIKYKISLISHNIYKCLTNIDYSNYATGSESCFDIIKNCAIGRGLDIDKDTFDTVKTNVKLDYITNGNDNFASVVKYTLGKMYYYGVADDSMKFIFYDELRQKYRLFDMKNTQQTSTGYRTVVLSLMKSNAESLIVEEPVKLGTVTRFSQTDIINTFSKKYMSKYDYGLNSFGINEIEIKKLQNYYNKKPDAQEPMTRPRDFKTADLNLDIRTRGSYWNNDFNIYGEITRCLLKNNALMVEVDGNIQCIPGFIVMVKIDRDCDMSHTEDPDQMKDQLNRYISYEGAWYTARVRSYVRPSVGKYKQVLTLVRNFRLAENTDDSGSSGSSGGDQPVDEVAQQQSSARKRLGAL